MGKYKKCPRCELNWIPIEEELCEVCKAELGKASKISLLEDDDEVEEEERICPICKVNYLEPDEDICAACREEQANAQSEKKTTTIGKNSLTTTNPFRTTTKKENFLSINFRKTKKTSSKTTKKRSAPTTLTTTNSETSTISTMTTMTTMTTTKKTKSLKTTKNKNHRTNDNYRALTNRPHFADGFSFA